ncbi:MAG: hypothetical protein LBE34_02125 [Flavobacteriaceae bacterium]|jgi:hypothetical protein|nr:hypothetical protein [Flavobacteriaceae bacterium]
MKKILLITFSTILVGLLFSCKKDDDSAVIVDKPELTLQSSAKEVTIGTEVTFTVTSAKKPVVGAVIQMTTGEQLKAYKWTPTKEGVYTFTALKAEYNLSNKVEIKVVAAPVKDEASVSYKGQAIALDGTLLQLDKFEWADEKKKDVMLSAWSFVGINEQLGKMFFVFFNTPAVDLGSGKYNYTLPDEKNVSNVFVIVLQKAADGKVETENIAFEGISTSFKLAAKPSGDQIKGEVEVNCTNLGGAAFKFVNKGNINIVVDLKNKKDVALRTQLFSKK